MKLLLVYGAGADGIGQPRAGEPDRSSYAGHHRPACRGRGVAEFDVRGSKHRHSGAVADGRRQERNRAHLHFESPRAKKRQCFLGKGPDHRVRTEKCALQRESVTDYKRYALTRKPRRIEGFDDDFRPDPARISHRDRNNRPQV
jgi:hypothetical protein